MQRGLYADSNAAAAAPSKRQRLGSAQHAYVDSAQPETDPQPLYGTADTLWRARYPPGGEGVEEKRRGADSDDGAHPDDPSSARPSLGALSQQSETFSLATLLGRDQSLYSHADNAAFDDDIDNRDESPYAQNMTGNSAVDEVDMAEENTSSAPNTPAKRKRGRPPRPYPMGDPKRALENRVRKSDRRLIPPPSTPSSFTVPFFKRVSPSKLSRPVDSAGVDLEEPDNSFDPKGEEKVAKDGQLLGKRSFRFQPFKLIERHPTRYYVFAADVAKCVGERDAYTLFQRHCEELKLHTSEEDREHLITIGRLASHLKSRNLTIMTARNAFRRFGHVLVLNGKPIKDDYWVGDQEYTSDSEHDTRKHRFNTDQMIVSTLARPYQRTDVKSMSLDSIPESPSITAYAEKNRLPLPGAPHDRLYVCALSLRQYNARLTEQRRAIGPKVSDIHTGIDLVRQDFQPTHMRVEMRVDSYARQSIHNGTLPKSYIDPVITIRPPSSLSSSSPSDSTVQWAPSGSGLQNNDSRLYPLALQTGQWQASYPIHHERLLSQRLKGPQPYPPSYQQHYWQVNLPHLGRSNSTSTPNSTTDHTLPSAHSPKSMSKPNMCAGYREDGAPCGRRVVETGDYCRYHTHQLREKRERDKKNLAKKNSSTPGTPTNNSSGNTSSQKNSSVAIPEGYCGDCRGASDDLPPNRPKSIPATISCTKCTRFYHPSCVEISSCVALEKIQSYEWECPDCKLCIACSHTGDEGKMLFCDDCDRGWHSYCLSPPLDEIPDGKWHCPLCTYCVACHKRDVLPLQLRTAIVDTRTGEEAQTLNDLVHNQFLGMYCDKCWPRFYKNLCCPMCLRTYSEDGSNTDDDREQGDGDMVSCDTCERWVHVRCDPALSRQRYRQLSQDTTQRYNCPVCENRVEALEGSDGSIRIWRGKPIYISGLVKRGEYQFRPGQGITLVDKHGKVVKIVLAMVTTKTHIEGESHNADSTTKSIMAPEGAEEEKSIKQEQVELKHEEDPEVSSTNELDEDEDEDEEDDY